VAWAEWTWAAWAVFSRTGFHHVTPIRSQASPGNEEDEFLGGKVMHNQLKFENINGIWDVSLSLSAKAPNDYLSEAWWNKIVGECNRICVADGIHATSSHSGASGIIGLHAHFELENKAKSLETKQKFRCCEKKIKEFFATA
jgi:hypothetical protein